MTIVSGTGEIEWYVPSANAGTRFVMFVSTTAGAVLIPRALS